ncbi:hypothetical protein SLE2022_065720 [Rubroshorea leprosula]
MESEAKRKLVMESREAASRNTATKPGRRTAANAGGKRKPLADCSNTIASLTSSQSSSSSAIKPPKSSVPLKSQLKQANTNAGSYFSTTTADSHQNNVGSPTPTYTFPPLPQSTSVSGSGTIESCASVYTRRKSKGKEITEPETLDFSQVTRILNLRDKNGHGNIGLSKSSAVPVPGKKMDKKKEDGNANLSKSSAVLVPGKKKDKRIEDGYIGLSKSSAVPVPGKKMDKMNEDGNIDLSKSSTVPVPQKKKQCRHALPKEFIETQKAYYDEIDKFELPVEEVVSVDELE